MLKPCERLIERNAQKDWVESQIQAEAERAVNVANEMLARRVPARYVRSYLIEYMNKVTRHYMPIVQTAVPSIRLVFNYEVGFEPNI